MAKQTTHARGIQPAGVFTSTYRWVYPCTAKALWNALTRDIDVWWPREFFAQASSQRFTLSPKLGGAMREEGPRGAGLLWGTVWAIEPGASLLIVGHTTPRFGGPCTGTMEYTVEAVKGGASLTLTHGHFGKADPAARRSLDDGWKTLFDGALRAYLEPRAVVSTAKRPKVRPHRA